MSEALVPILHASDARANARWYAQLGFEVESEHQFPPGMPYYCSSGAARSCSISPSTAAMQEKERDWNYFYVDDVDSIAAEFGETVRDQPWGCREVWIDDPDGNRLWIGMGLVEGDP